MKIMFEHFFAALYAFLSGKPSAYAKLATLRVNNAKANVDEARELLIAEEQRAVRTAETSISALNAVATAATTSETEAETARNTELTNFESATDRKIKAIEARLAAFKTRRAALKSKLNSKLQSERDAAKAENEAIAKAIGELGRELAGLAEQQDIDEAIAESLNPTDSE
jgi:vacuolar-type H+-ATPase subunit I/STV1